MLEKLSQVQTLDLDVDAIESKKQLVPPDLTETRARQAQLERELAGVSESYHDLRRQINANELEISNLSSRRKAAADSASAAASAKEVAQYQNQELQFATRAQELEEDTLPLMEELEQKAEEMAGLKAQLAEMVPELEAQEELERERVAALDARDADLADRRTRLGTEVDPALLRQYEQVRRARRGLALVGLQDGKRCGGCHVQLPIHVVQKVRKGVGVTRCPSCGRLLHQTSG
jgi:uncharacterized protein